MQSQPSFHCRWRMLLTLLVMLVIAMAGSPVAGQSTTTPDPTLPPPTIALPAEPTLIFDGTLPVFDSTTVPALPTVDLPAEPTLVFDGTLPVTWPPPPPPPEHTPTSVVFGDGLYRLSLRFLPLGPGSVPESLAGQICARPVVTPALASGPLESHCTSDSEARFDYYPSSSNPFPRESIYRVQVDSNASGCVVITDSYREYFENGNLPVAEVFVLIDCDVDVEPFPTIASTEIAAIPAYEEVRVQVRDSTGNYRYFGDPLCLRASVTPAADVMGNGESCVSFAGRTGSTLTLRPGPDALLVSSIYAATIVRNETGCDVTQSFRAEGNIGYVTVLTTCTDPATYDSVSLRLYDEAGEESVALGGELCIAIDVDPALSTGARLGELCTTDVEAAETWLPSSDPFATSSTYTARVTRNGTLCTVGAASQGIERDATGLHVYLAVPVDCAAASIHTPTPFVVDPENYAQFLLLFTEGDTVRREYPGILCVEISVSPPIYSGSWVGTMCEGHSPETTVWRSDMYVSLPIASTYRATVISNSTGCEARPDPEVVNEVIDGVTLGRMVVWIICPDTTTTPPPTGAASPTDPASTVPTTESSVTPTPTHGITPTSTALPTESLITPVETHEMTPTTAGGITVPAHEPTPTPVTPVSMLPTTGSGVPGGPLSVSLIFIAAALWATSWWSSRQWRGHQR